MKKHLTLIFAVMGLIFILIILKNTPLQEPIKKTFFAFDTIIDLTGHGKNVDAALADVQSDIAQLETEFSRTLPESTIYQLNHGDGTPMFVSSDISGLLEQAKALYKETSGIFDITIAPAADLWGFTKEQFHVPTPEELSDVKTKIGIDHLHIQSNSIQLDPGSELDLGGIAKGYALERALSIFQKDGLNGGIANLGGDILVYGKNSKNVPWKIAIRDPNNDEFLGILSTSDQYILTSGGYERYFEENGKVYQHIIDPRSCSPAESDLKSATIITKLSPGSGIKSDVLSTSFIVMGKDAAIDFWRSRTFDFDMILVDDHDHVYLTDGLKNIFTPQKDSNYQYLFLK